MQQRKERLAYLMDVYTNHRATVQEEQELMEWLQEAQEDAELQTYVKELWNLYADVETQKEVNWDQMFDRVVQQETDIPVRNISARNWYRIAAAAAVLILLSGAAWWLLKPVESKNVKEQLALTPADAIAPGNKAVVALADGREVSLDSLQQGLLAQQGNVRLVKNKEGELSYEMFGNGVAPLQFNTLINPRGSKVISMVLADGSRVWLNSGSSIKYPVAFATDERKVEVNGEAYFEITQNSKQSFKVTRGNMTVQVLGTHFNVNAYDDEEDIKVTLLSGSVKVSSGKASELLKPGQQASVQNERMNVKNVAVDEVMSWRDGIFLLENTDFATLMRQISRWYNVKIVYESTVPKVVYGGGVSKDKPLSQIIQILESLDVKCKLDDNILTIK